VVGRFAGWKWIELLKNSETHRVRSRKWGYALKLTVGGQQHGKQHSVRIGFGQARFHGHVHEKPSGQNC